MHRRNPRNPSGKDHIQKGKNKDNVSIPRTKGKHTLSQGGTGEITGNFPLEIQHHNGIPFLKCWKCLSTERVKLRNISQR